MTGRRNIIIAISAIVVFAAVVGFFITLDVSPQIAYARLFIDAGLVIGLIAVVMAFYREKELSTDGLVQSLRSLANGQYKTRLNPNDLGPLSDVATVINELAAALEEQHHKQEEIKRNLREELLPGLKQKDAVSFEHSIHPELGPVLNVPVVSHTKPVKETSYSFRDVMPVPIAKLPTINDHKLNNSLIDSKPPKVDAPMINLPLENDRQEQDLDDLYQRFISAQKAFNIDQIEYSLFLHTIEKTKLELMSSYRCNGILFDIVKESNQVALQPKIVRSSPV